MVGRQAARDAACHYQDADLPKETQLDSQLS